MMGWVEPDEWGGPGGRLGSLPSPLQGSFLCTARLKPTQIYEASSFVFVPASSVQLPVSLPLLQSGPDFLLGTRDQPEVLVHLLPGHQVKPELPEQDGDRHHGFSVRELVPGALARPCEPEGLEGVGRTRLDVLRAEAIRVESGNVSTAVA